MLMETQNIHAPWDAVAPAIRAARLVPPRRGWFHPDSHLQTKSRHQEITFSTFDLLTEPK